MRSKRPWLLYLLISSQAQKRASPPPLYAQPAGTTSIPRSPARRVRFSELLRAVS